MHAIPTPLRHLIPTTLFITMLPGMTLADITPYAARPEPLWQTATDTYAISGDHVMIRGYDMKLEGLTCPDPETTPGRAAKALMNTYLRTNMVCHLTGKEGAIWLGQCSANGKDVADAMQQAGYCS
jgi:hypothetical protein